MAEQKISLDGVPEPVAHAIEVVVQMARRSAEKAGGQPDEKTVRELPKWKGQVIGKLSRREMYDDV